MALFGNGGMGANLLCVSQFNETGWRQGESRMILNGDPHWTCAGLAWLAGLGGRVAVKFRAVYGFCCSRRCHEMAAVVRECAGHRVFALG